MISEYRVGFCAGVVFGIAAEFWCNSKSEHACGMVKGMSCVCDGRKNELKSENALK